MSDFYLLIAHVKFQIYHGCDPQGNDRIAPKTEWGPRKRLAEGYIIRAELALYLHGLFNLSLLPNL